jgi:hypothetical protein
VYGDKDIHHDQIAVRDQWDYTEVPGDYHVDFNYVEPIYINGSHGTNHWEGSNGLFLNYIISVGDTPADFGDYYPAGIIRMINGAYRIIEDDRGLVWQVLQPDYSKDVSVWISPNNRPYDVYWEGWEHNMDHYSIESEDVLYDRRSQIWYIDHIACGQVKRTPEIPYYWHSIMWDNHPPYAGNDYAALSECFRETMAKVSSSQMNNLQNLKEIAGLISAIKQGHIEDLYSSLADFCREKNIKNAIHTSQDAWLKYRYLYGTTKMDAEAMVDYLLEEKFKPVDDSRVIRGSIGISDGTLRLKMRLHESMDLATRIRHEFKSAGLFPDAYTLWDAVPFSFVVDWFAPDFSNELEDLSQKYLSSMYEVDELLVTHDCAWSFDYKDFTWNCKSYTREFLDEPPQFEFYQEEKTPSGVTVTKRWIDGFALFVR